jgi:hypothetical protein
VKKLCLFFLFALVVTLMPSAAAGQTGNGNGNGNAKANPNVTPLGNKDIVFMVDQKLDSEAIIKAIKSSPCTFDTFPPLLREMKRRGVPDEVLQAMVDAPYGPSLQSRDTRDDLGEEPIYHYADQLKQLGYIAPLSTGRRSQSSRRNRPTRTRRPQ